MLLSRSDSKILQSNEGAKLTGRVLLIREASALIGIGHLIRTNTLGRYLQSAGFITHAVSVENSAEHSLALSNNAPSESSLTSGSVTNNVQLEQVISSFNPSIIIIDAPSCADFVIRFCMQEQIISVALDYFKIINPMPAVIINLIDHSESAVAGSSPVRRGVQYFEGPEFAIVRDQFSAARHRRLKAGNREQVENILITFGGADPLGNTLKALNEISTWNGRETVEVVIGPLYRDPEELSRKTEGSNINIVLRRHTWEIANLMESADLVFCGGGGTLLESLCIGVPTIVIPQSVAEERHAGSLAKRGACHLLDDAVGVEIRSLSYRNQLSTEARKCVDEHGSKRIAEIIEKFQICFTRDSDVIT